MNTLWQDLRYGARMLLKQPGFTLIAVITLALGIGANTAIFSLINTILLRPLPVLEPQQVVSVNLTGASGEMSTFSYPTYRDVRDRNDVLSGLAVHRPAPISVSREGGQANDNERVWGFLVTGNYFGLLGAGAALGRTFTAEEDRAPLTSPLVVLGYGYWQRRFAADPNIVGQTVLLNGRRFTIIGVAPENFTGTELIFKPELFVPSQMQDWIEPGNVGSLTNRGNGQWFAIGRLKPGVTQAQAQAALDAVVAQLGREFPNEVGGATLSLQPPGLLLPQIRGAVIGFSAVLLAAVALVLLVACTNLAGLLLARAATRRKEVAVRLSLGATRGRIVRQLLTESVLLSLAGGLFGILLAVWLVDLFAAIKLPTSFPLALRLYVDWRVLVFALLASLVTGLLFGLAPAWQTARPELVPALKDDAGGGGYRRSRLRSGLVVAQIALSLMILVAAGLVIRSLQRAQALGPGFVTERALALSLDLDLQGYDEPRGQEFQRRLLERVTALPGVQSAGFTGYLPLSLSYNSTSVRPEGGEQMRNPPEAMNASVSPQYFAAMGIPLVAGRDFSEQDKADGIQVAIINETLARQFFPNQNVIGKRIQRGSDGPWLEVVGVAKDGKYWHLGEDPRLFLYQPLTQNYWGGVTLIVRTAADPQRVIAAVRSEVRGLDATLPVFDVKTLSEHTSLSLFPLRLGAGVLGSFGLLALLLAGVGIYGVTAYSVAQRTRELGIRMALGADARAIVRLILRQGMKLAITGLAFGLMGAWLLTRLMSGLLAGVSANDPLAFALIAGGLLLVVLVACWVPARRATQVDPLVALRCE